MEDIPIRMPKTRTAKRVEAAVERACDEQGLLQAMKDTLGKYPGCVHWHYKRKGVSGTIELTYWPSEDRLWISVQEGRRADWIDEALPELQADLERRLK